MCNEVAKNENVIGIAWKTKSVYNIITGKILNAFCLGLKKYVCFCLHAEKKDGSVGRDIFFFLLFCIEINTSDFRSKEGE